MQGKDRTLVEHQMHPWIDPSERGEGNRLRASPVRPDPIHGKQISQIHRNENWKQRKRGRFSDDTGNGESTTTAEGKGDKNQSSSVDVLSTRAKGIAPIVSLDEERVSISYYSSSAIARWIADLVDPWVLGEGDGESRSVPYLQTEGFEGSQPGEIGSIPDED